MRRLATVLGALLIAVGGAGAQEPARDSTPADPARGVVAGDTLAAGPLRSKLLVTGVAGGTIYVSFETEAAASGTWAALGGRDADEPGGAEVVLDVAREEGGATAGRLRVLERVGRRLLVAFEGDPFPITRGASLYVELPRGAARAALAGGPAGRDARAGAPAGRALRGADRAPGRTRISGPRLSGLIAIESDLQRSTSFYQGTRDGIVYDGTIDRTFSTPGARLRATLGGLPGGVSAHTSVRAYHRDRTSRRPLDESRVQILEAYVNAAPGGAPFELQGGRFLNRYEAFTGYWDGGLLRIGTRNVGVGGAVGWEPAVREERLDRDLFKYGGFFTAEAGSGRTRYRAAISAVRLDPRDGGLRRTVAGVSQRLTAGNLRLDASLEAERDTATDRWVAARVRLGASVNAGPVTLRASAARLRAPDGVLFDPTVDSRRAGPRVGQAHDRVGGGLSLRIGSGSAGGDVTLSRDRNDRDSRTYAGHLLLPRALPGRLGLRLTGFWWEDRRDNRALSGSAGLSRTFGRVRADVGYRFDRSERSGLAVISHGFQIGLSVSTSSGWSYQMDGFARRGADLQTERLYTRLARSF